MRRSKHAMYETDSYLRRGSVFMQLEEVLDAEQLSLMGCIALDPLEISVGGV